MHSRPLTPWLLPCLFASAAWGQGAPLHNASCVQVSVNEQAALSYACLNQHLQNAAASASMPTIAMDAVTHASSNQQVGQFNFSAFSHRMGDALGKSVVPQRPPPLQAAPTFPGMVIHVH